MTTEQRVSYLNTTAGQDLTGPGFLDKAVSINGTIASNARDALGILKSKAPQGVGVRVADNGVIKGYAGAAINTVGFPVTVTTSGYMIAAPVGSAMVGKAWTTAASGDLFPFLGDFSVPGVA